MVKPIYLSEEDHQRISDAVAFAEQQSAGEIVTILADRSDGYTDVALAWAAFVAFLALGILAIVPDFYLGLYDRFFADWGHEWTPRMILSLALGVACLKFGGMLLLQLWQPLKFFLIPSPIRTMRVHNCAMRAFRIGAEKRTAGRTGILIYLSMREHRAEILADEMIARHVSADTWEEAMNGMLADLRDGRTTDAMITAIQKVTPILNEYVPRQDGDINELPDRLIEV